MRLKLLLLFALLLAQSAAGQIGDRGVKVLADTQSFVSEKKLALLIGINEYPEESGLSKLKWARNDAEDLAAELKRQGYIVDSLLDSRVTKTSIRRHLSDMLKRLDPNEGTVIVAFSGHGGQVGREQYLATFESSADDLDKSGISVAELRTQLEESGAPRTMMFLDACRNVTTPGAKDSVAPIEAMTELSSSRGLRLMVSTGPKTRSYEYDDIKHGLFSYYLIEGLKGAAAGADGLVTFGELATYVTRNVREKNPNQIPYTDGQSTGDFLLGRSATAPALLNGAGRQMASLGNRTVSPVRSNDTGTAQGENLINPVDSLNYVWIPSGKFSMGCSASDKDCRPDEKPAHEVTLTHGFWMTTTEVTVEAYKKYSISSMPPSSDFNRNWNDGTQPITKVTFAEAAGYCAWARGRLPTEAEWEFAARAGGGGPYPSGSDAKKLGNFAGTADGFEYLAPVKKFAPNRWGLYDMAGNAAEWVQDGYSKAYSPDPATDPRAEGNGLEKVVRGGSFADDVRRGRVSARGPGEPQLRNNQIGFRCVLPELGN